MQKYIPVAARIMLSQIFLVQVIILINSFMNNPGGYQAYQMGLIQHGVFGIFAPLSVLVNFVGGLALFLGYKTRFFALVMAIWAIALPFALSGLPTPPSPLQYLAIAGGLLLLYANPTTACSLDYLKK